MYFVKHCLPPYNKENSRIPEKNCECPEGYIDLYPEF